MSLIANIFLIAGAILLFFIAILSSVFYHSIEELNRSEYSEIKNQGTTVSSMIVKLLDDEKRSLSALEFAIITFEGLSLLLSVFIVANNDISIKQPWFYIIIALGILAFFLLAAIFIFWIPKYYSNEKEVTIVSRQAVMIQIIIWIFKPCAAISLALEKHFTKNTNNINALSGDEMSDVIEIAEGGDDVETEAQMLKGIVRFGDLVVNEIMKSRVDIEAIEISKPWSEVVTLSKNTGFSRIPVYQDSIDNIKGVLYVKDLLSISTEQSSKNWTKFVREPFFVPETKSVSDLLREFQTLKTHMAIVVDEYGGTSGLITLEDIIEEIFGEITDEYDKTEDLYKIDPEGNYIFEAKTSIVDFCKVMELSDEEFDEYRGEAETLAGLILEVVGEIPHIGENVTIKNFVFTIQKADNRRIEQVKVLQVKTNSK